jgi:hypothetical protein
MVEVKLSPEEIQSALQFVEAMREDKKEYNVVDKKFDAKNTSWAVNLMGYLGELAAAKVYKTTTDNRVLTGGDAGHDLVVDDKTYQVKTTVTKELIFNSKELFSADYAILVTLIGDRTQPHIDSRFIVWGDISREDFLKVCKEKNYGYGERFVCDVNALNQVVSG